MGSGASNSNPQLQQALAEKEKDTSLTAEEKAKLNNKIALKYAELTADPANQNISKSASANGSNITASDKLELEESTDLFSTLQKEYDAEAEKIKQGRNAYGRTFQMLKQKSTNYFGEAPTSGSTFIFNVTKSDSAGNSPSGSFKGGSPFLLQRQQTSKELIEALHSNSSPISSSAEQVEENVKVFVDQLKSGEVKTKKASEFRKKRLTYDFQEAQAGGEKESSPPTPPMGGTMGARQSSMNPHRKASIRATGPATIFTADEIGAVQNGIIPPFPSTVVGVFSCHGVEPGEDDYGEECVNDKINQDRGCVVCPYRGTRSESFFMVLDGHGQQGDRISEFAMRQIAISLETHPLLSTDPAAALTETFVNTNTALLVTPMNFMTSGCTCVAVYQTGNTLYVANCGDSRAVIGFGGADGAVLAKDLSRDHKPDDPVETARITSSGGFVKPAPHPGLSARVYLDQAYTMIGLAMARSIGDYAVKSVGVTAEPEVTVFEIEENYKFLIMASDGVWEFISSQEAVDIVQNALSVVEEGAEADCDDACQDLIEEAAKRWRREEGDYRDDITAIVIRLPLPPPVDEN